MPVPTIAGLPPFFTLAKGMAVRITALDPTNGSQVTGVILSEMALSVDQDTGPPLSTVPISPNLLPGMV